MSKTRIADSGTYLKRAVLAAVLFAAGITLPGCALVEGVGRALNIVVDIAEEPAQINSFSVDPRAVELHLGCNFSTSEVVRARWDVVGKRVHLLVDGTTVHEQSTPDVRDTIVGETDVEINLTSLGNVRLVAYNAVDQAVAQAIPVSITAVPSGPPCEPPCTPGVDC